VSGKGVDFLTILPLWPAQRSPQSSNFAVSERSPLAGRKVTEKERSDRLAV
jgi:hypothetical protein